MDKKPINWSLSPKEAIELQKKLKAKIRLEPLKQQPKLIGGAEVSMNLFSTDGFAGFVTLDLRSLEEVSHAVVKNKINFPYIPGLLSFREIPTLLLSWEKLKIKPDVVIVDGVGIAHPRRMGIATHLGLILGVPTIGCSKKLLTGICKEPENTPGAISYIYDKYNPEEVLGAALRSKKNVKPIFISPGHLITLSESIKIAKQCLRKHRLPEATRLAHNTVNRYRLKDLEKDGNNV